MEKRKEKNQNYIKAGEVIREKRLAKHWSQNYLAKKAKLDVTYVSKLENASLYYSPREEKVLAIAKQLELSDKEFETILVLYGKFPSKYQELFTEYYDFMPTLLNRLYEDPTYAKEVFIEAGDSDLVYK